MIRRSRRALPAALVALVVLALATGAAVAAGQVLVGQAPWIPVDAVAAALAPLTPGSAVVLGVAGAVAVLGLVLLLVALAPGAPTVLPLAPQGSWPAAGVTRRSTRTALTAAARRVDGVDGAAVRLRGWKVTAVVSTPLGEPGALPDRVRAALTERLDDLAPDRPPRVRVRVRNSGSA